MVYDELVWVNKVELNNFTLTIRDISWFGG